MTKDFDNFTQQLDAFCRQQVALLQASDITKITTHLIITAAFFTGAAIYFSKACKVSKAVYLSAVKNILMENFNLAAENAEGLLESNSRMYKRYMLIEKIYKLGWKAAQIWQKNPDAGSNTLSKLLKKYQNLSMSDLAIEGVKEAIPIPAAEKTYTQTKTVTKAGRKTSKPHRAVLLWLLMTALMAATLLGVLFPQYLSPTLEEILRPLRELVIKTIMSR